MLDHLRDHMHDRVHDLIIDLRFFSFDTKSVKLLQEFFSRETDPSGIPYYRSRIDGRWKTETIQALAKYLHDQKARVAFTRDFHPKYNFIKGNVRS